MFGIIPFLVGRQLAQNQVSDPDTVTRTGLLMGTLGVTPMGLVTTSLILRDQQAREQAAATSTRSTPGASPAPSPAPAPAPATAPAAPAAPSLAAVPTFGPKDSFSSAEQILKQNELQAQSTLAISEDVAKGNVVGTSPTGGTVVAVGSVVTVYVSAGVRVPDVTGQALFCADVTLNDLHLRTLVTPDDALPQDSVRSQDPAAGEFVSRGDPVKLTVEHAASKATAEPAAAAAAIAVRSETTSAARTGGVPAKTPSGASE